MAARTSTQLSDPLGSSDTSQNTGRLVSVHELQPLLWKIPSDSDSIRFVRDEATKHQAVGRDFVGPHKLQCYDSIC